MTEDIIFSRSGSLGFITLNRSSALNALTLAMINDIQTQLELWKKDDTLCAVIVQSAPGSAFCAGGDIRWLYNRRGNWSEQMQFFWHEYRLNHFIHEFGKPYIALMDGVTMGGGVGISLHGSHPVATERFVFAMPETGIGFFPDIGASNLLARCPGYLGMYIGLTGNRLGPEDALQAGLVKYTLPSEQIPSLIEDLQHLDLSQNANARVSECLKAYHTTVGGASLKSQSSLIGEAFSQPTIESMIEYLSDAGEEGHTIASIMGKKSPLSLKITQEQLQKASGLSLAQCLQMDFNLVYHFMNGEDFYEGVRALLVDKDKKPQWNPANLLSVSYSRVVSYFESVSNPLQLIESL